MASVSRFPQSLGDLVTAAKVRHKVTSGRALETTSRQLGIHISYTVLNELEAGTYRRRMTPETRSRLATLAGVSKEIVDRLAGAPLGKPFKLPVDESATLTGDQRDALLGTFRAFVTANRALEEAEMRADLVEAANAPKNEPAASPDEEHP